MYQWLLFAHLLGVVLMVAGSAVYVAAVDRLPRTGGMVELRGLLAVAVVGERLLVPGWLLLIVAGVTLAARSWSFADGWIATSIGLLVVQIAGSSALVEPRVRRIKAAAAGTGDGPVPPALAARCTDPVLHATDRATAAVVVAVLLLMTVKPGTGGILLTLLGAVAGGAALAASGARARAGTSIS